jgi:hypothetical protein
VVEFFREDFAAMMHLPQPMRAHALPIVRATRKVKAAAKAAVKRVIKKRKRRARPVSVTLPI